MTHPASVNDTASNMSEPKVYPELALALFQTAIEGKLETFVDLVEKVKGIAWSNKHLFELQCAFIDAACMAAKRGHGPILAQIEKYDPSCLTMAVASYAANAGQLEILEGFKHCWEHNPLFTSSLLRAACQGRQYAVVEHLVDQGAEVTQNQGELLTIAINKKDLDMVILLFKLEEASSQKNFSDQMLAFFMHARKIGDLGLITYFRSLLISNGGQGLNAEDIIDSLITDAAKQGLVNNFNYFIEEKKERFLLSFVEGQTVDLDLYMKPMLQVAAVFGIIYKQYGILHAISTFEFAPKEEIAPKFRETLEALAPKAISCADKQKKNKPQSTIESQRPLALTTVREEALEQSSLPAPVLFSAATSAVATPSNSFKSSLKIAPEFHPKGYDLLHAASLDQAGLIKKLLHAHDFPEHYYIDAVKTAKEHTSTSALMILNKHMNARGLKSLDSERAEKGAQGLTR